MVGVDRGHRNKLLSVMANEMYERASARSARDDTIRQNHSKPAGAEVYLANLGGGGGGEASTSHPWWRRPVSDICLNNYLGTLSR